MRRYLFSVVAFVILSLNGGHAQGNDTNSTYAVLNAQSERTALKTLSYSNAYQGSGSGSYGTFTIQSGGSNFTVRYTPNGTGPGLDRYVYGMTGGGSTTGYIYVATVRQVYTIDELRPDSQGHYNLNQLMGTLGYANGIPESLSITYRWYSSQTGGSPISDAQQYTVAPGTTTDLYVEAILSNNGSEKATIAQRIKVTISGSGTDPGSNSNKYFIVPNLDANANTVNKTLGHYRNAQFLSHTSNYGSFSFSNNNLRYRTSGTANAGGMDKCVIRYNGEEITCYVVVFSARPTSIRNEEGIKHDLNNSMTPIEQNLPQGWNVRYTFHTRANGNNGKLNYSGISIGTGNETLTYYASASLSIDPIDQPVVESTERARLSINPITTGNRSYGIVMPYNRGFGKQTKLIHTAARNYKIVLTDNYSNSSTYGHFSLANNDRELYYTTDNSYTDYGMDRQAFTIVRNNQSPGWGTAGSRIAYATTVRPQDKLVGDDGWAILEMTDNAKGMPRDMFVRYKFHQINPNATFVKNQTIPLGNQLSSVNDRKAIAEDVELETALGGNRLGGLKQNDPGYEITDADGRSYNTQSFAVVAELMQTTGTSEIHTRYASATFPTYTWGRYLPEWLTRATLDEVEWVLESPSYAVCPENPQSNLNQGQNSYDISIELEVKAVAYHRVQLTNGSGQLGYYSDENEIIYLDADDPIADDLTPAIVREVNSRFDLTDIAEFIFFYDQEGTHPLPTSSGNTTPYHSYKVGKSFPGTGSVSTASTNYGTLKGNGRAIYVQASIPKKLIDPSYTGNDAIVIEPQDGEIRIARGLCGEDRENDCGSGDHGSVLFFQNFGGENENDPIYYNSHEGEGLSSAVEEALRASAYEYKYYPENPSSGSHGLPYIDEGEFVLSKQTEPHGTGWTSLESDHSNPGNNNVGYMMLVNAGVEKGTLFDYTLTDLCAGAKVIFSAWIKNVLRASGEDPVDQIFEVYNAENKNLLGRYVTGPILNPVNYSEGQSAADSDGVNDWKLYGFEFELPDNVSDIYLKIVNNGKGSSGNDFAIDDIKVRLCSMAEIEFITSGTQAACTEDNQIDVRFSLDNYDDQYFCWLYSPTEQITDDWLIVHKGIVLPPAEGESKKDLHFNPRRQTSEAVDPALYPDYPTGYYRLALGYGSDFLEGNCYGSSDPVLYYGGDIGESYLWTGTVDGSWSDPDNWVVYDPTGSRPNQAAAVHPAQCNDVYIPGRGITNYPVVTDGDECHHIYFMQGGHLENPQLLTYTRAYVDFNFGHVTDITEGPYANRVPVNSNPSTQAYYSDPLSRGQWHTLASPINKVVVGDFSLGGKPFTWHRNFIVQSSDLHAEADWSEVYNDGDIFLADHFNAMALFVGQYAPVPGLSDQSNLHRTDGILRIPYYSDENSAHAQNHPLHLYQNGNSIFTYFQNESLEALWDREDLKEYIPREVEEGHRFVFEEAGNNDYSYRVDANTYVLIGNPFTSLFDFDRFIEDNAGKVQGNTYYEYTGSYVSSSLCSFKTYTAGTPQLTAGMASRYIRPLNAFIVKTTGNPGEQVSLRFTFNQAVAQQNAVAALLRSAPASDFLLLEAQSSKGGSSSLTLSFQNGLMPGNAEVIRMKDSETLDLFAIDPRSGKRNAVQFEGGFLRKTIPLGLFACSEEAISIRLLNPDQLNLQKLLLVDKHLQKTIDLLEEDSYTFTYHPEAVNRFELHLETTDTPLDHPLPATLVYRQGRTVHINSSYQPIREVELFDLRGMTVEKATNIDQTEYSTTLSEHLKAVIVKVRTDSNESTHKVVLE